MSVRLLDLNVLLALAWPSHLHHGSAHRWFTRHHASGWATCPITQCGFVRISSNPKIIPEAVTPIEAWELLSQVTRVKGHVFWEDDIELAKTTVSDASLTGHRQITDFYLAHLARHHGGKLATFDKGLLELLSPGTEGRKVIEVIPSSG